MHQLVIHPGDIARIPFGDLPEIEHADFLQELAQHRPDSIDLFQVVCAPEGRLFQQVGLVAPPAHVANGIDIARHTVAPRICAGFTAPGRCRLCIAINPFIAPGAIVSHRRHSRGCRRRA